MQRRFSPKGQLPTTPVRIVRVGIPDSGGGMHQRRMRGFIGFAALFSLLGAGPQDPPAPHRLASTPTYSIKTDVQIGNIRFQDVNGDGFPDLICAGNNGGDEAPSFIYLSKEGRFD